MSWSHLICRTIRSRPDSYRLPFTGEQSELRINGFVQSALYSTRVSRELPSPRRWGLAERVVQSLFRLLRKSESKISDCKAGTRKPGEAPGSRGSECGLEAQEMFCQDLCEASRLGHGTALHGTGRTFPSYQSGREGPFT